VSSTRLDTAVDSTVHGGPASICGGRLDHPGWGVCQKATGRVHEPVLSGWASSDSPVVKSASRFLPGPRYLPAITRKFLDVKDWYRPHNLVKATTGMRIGELAGANCGDWNGVELKVYGGKSGASFRTLTVGGATAAARDRLAADRPADAPLLPTITGVRLNPDNFRRDVWNPSMQRLGFSYRPHVARRFCASALIQDGVPLPEVARWMGHADASVTAKVYAAWFTQDHVLSTATMTKVGERLAGLG